MSPAAKNDRFASRLISWYFRNKRDLPWRETRDPYRIWLSEIILQQTRVQQGLSYYLRFEEAFPNIESLAKAPEEKVLRLWQGLGYYSRARNLHAAARQVMNEHGGVFPNDHSAILRLKGVGSYTAAAIASFSFGQSYPVVDGNVMRVLSRVFAIRTPVNSSKAKKEFYELAQELIDPSRPDMFNQAIMELGALCCKPQNPDCMHCPLQDTCIANQQGTQQTFPVKNRKSTPRDRYFFYLVMSYRNRILMRKREENDIWKNLYDFPLIETAKGLSIPELMKSREYKNRLKDVSYKGLEVSPEYKHVLSHQRIHAVFISVDCNKKPVLSWAKSPVFAWLDPAERDKIAIPRLIEQYLFEAQGKGNR